MKKKLILIGAILSLIVLVFAFDLHRYLTLEQLREHKAWLDDYKANHLFLMVAIYVIAYIVMAALSIPGAAVLTLAAGTIFGNVLGLTMVSFSSTIGATLAFLSAKMLLGESIQEKYADKLKIVNEKIEQDGASYLLSLRLMPIFPFFLINLLMGMTKLPTWKFFLVSQIGMLPGTFIYVNAGTALSSIQTLGDIFSARMFLSFLLLGLFPTLIKLLMNWIQKRREKVA